MNLLQVFISLIDEWRPVFCKQEAFNRAKEHAIALCSLGRHTLHGYLFRKEPYQT